MAMIETAGMEVGMVTSDPLGRVRSDALPEFTDYGDTGCRLHASCLNCPQLHCLYDEPGTLRRWHIRARAVTAVLLIKAGIPMPQAQAVLSASRRSIYRWLHDLRPV